MSKYPFNSELKHASVNADYDLAELALAGKMDSAIRFMSAPVKKFRSKKAGIEQKTFTAGDGAEVEYYEFAPLGSESSSGRYPAMVYYHGGGFMFPIQKAMMENSCLYAENCGMKVFLVDYRYAPKVSCNRIMDDCVDMLNYVFDHADELKVDTDRVILYGDSAGGCLAACTALRNRDGAGHPIRGQLLVYPVCDNEYEKYESIDKYRYAPWSKQGNASMWKLYFYNGIEDIEHIVPMKADCHDLPRAYVEPQQMDVLRDEAIAYASKMKAAGVEVECNLINGSYHGFDAELKSPLVKRVFEHRYDVIREFIR